MDYFKREPPSADKVKLLRFLAEYGTNNTLKALAGITASQVKGVMQNIIDKDVFQFDTGSPIDGIKRAYIRETIITELPEA